MSKATLLRCVWDCIKFRFEKVWEEDDVDYEDKENWVQAFLKLFPSITQEEIHKQKSFLSINFGEPFLEVFDFEGELIALEHGCDGSAIYKIKKELDPRNTRSITVDYDFSESRRSYTAFYTDENIGEEQGHGYSRELAIENLLDLVDDG